MDDSLEVWLDPPESLWHSFWAKSEDRSIFTSIKFLRSLPHTFMAGLVMLGETPVLGALAPMDSRVGGYHGGFPFTLYQGLLRSGERPPLNAAETRLYVSSTEALLVEMMHRLPILVISNSWRLKDVRPIQWINHGDPVAPRFNLDLSYTAVLDLMQYRDLQDCMSNMQSNRRREWRKASSHVQVQRSEDVNGFVQLHKETLERSGGLINAELSELVRAMVESGIRENFGELLIASMDGEVIAANFFVWDDRTSFYLFGANHPELRHHHGGTLLMIEAIGNAMQRGSEEVDFLGANSPSRGDFKLSFGAELKPYVTASIESRVAWSGKTASADAKSALVHYQDPA